MSVKDTVLKVLEANKGLVVSGQKIAEEAGASRAAVWKAISQLREEGHGIQASTNKGYRLSSASDLLSAEGIHGACSRIPVSNIHCFKTIDSTNAKAKQLAIQGDIQVALIVSEEQTQGRGRMRREFFSPGSTGIYMSLLFKPTFDMTKSILVTTATSVAVCRGIQSVLGIDCRIKWVNDIFCNGLKVGGILTEGITNLESGHVEYIVVGIGINYSTPAGSFPSELSGIAGSLLPEGKSASHLSASRNQLIGSITTELLHLLDTLDEGNFLKEYKEKSLILGHQVVFSSFKDGTLVSDSGMAVDIDTGGGLVVELGNGERKVISSGEVTIRRSDNQYL